MRTILVFVIVAATPIYAQSLRGSIGGDVSNAEGQPISGASVTLTRLETNHQRKAVTNGQGGFTVTLLEPGTYRLEVDAPGYRGHVQQLPLELNQEIRVEVPLLPDQTSEQVNVTATASLLLIRRRSVA